MSLAQRVQMVRRRVRLRTRLRRAREAWRRAVPRRLPAWAGPATTWGPPPPVTTAGGLVMVDATAANPQGRQRYGPRLPAGTLVLAGDGAGSVRWEVRRGTGGVDGPAVVAGRVGDPFDRRQLAVLADLGVVTCGADPGPSCAGCAHLLAALAMTGVVVHAPDLSGVVASMLAPELAGLLRGPLPDRRGDPLAWELHSVRQRRAAMRHHAAGLVPPPVTALLVSNRPRLVGRALAALAAQTYPELEIVVGAHGFDADAALAAAGGSGSGAPGGAGAGGDREVRVVPVPAGRNLGAALAEATAAARGTLVTKVDDDDRYGPEHIWDLVLARHHAGTTVAGKGAEFVYLEPEDRTVRRRMGAELRTDTVAGGTILLARDDLAAAGGWPPVPRWVDRALLDRVLGGGGSVYRTHPFGFVYTRHGSGHTWHADPDYFRHDIRRRWRGLPPYPEFGDAGGPEAAAGGAGWPSR